MFKKVKFLLVAVLAMIASVANAQVTTAALTGLVTDGNEPIIGATVQAVHEPSGTHYGTITNIDGRYNIQGMRTGGPYKIEISYVGYQTVAYTGVTLNLGDPTHFNTEMKENAEVLQEVMVIATRSKFSSQKTGASININNEAITNMPTVTRSISDVTRMSPYSGGGMSFAGGDGRSANFTIDGANFNNNFGLSSALPGGGNPVSLDAIEEIQVVVAPFDVRQTNFIGGGVNAITKSGTNTIKGTAYTFYRNQDMRGNKINGEDLGDRPEESVKTYGFTLGGPIIKNKLFYFVNYEKEMTPGQVIKYHAKGHNGPGMESNCTIQDMNTVAGILRDKYGYEPGSATDFPGDESNSKILARLDWNINDAHHLALRFNNTKNMAWNAPNGNSCDAGTRDRSTNRVGETSMAFANSMYSMDNKVQSWSLDLNSRFGNNISNQLLATYSNIEDIRGSNSSLFPFIDIMDGNNHHYMSAGYELFTYNNGVHNKIFNVKDDFKYTLGSHNILAGVSYEHQYANNAYMRNATGYYRFSTLQDFIDCKPEAAAVCYGFNGVANPNAQVTFNQLGFYLQDDWNVNDNLKVNYGVRFDTMLFDNSDIATNKAIYALDFNGQKVDTGKWPNNKMQVSPRIGFSWDVFGDKSLKVRGGTGLFTGRLPLVFFTNMPTNAALVQNLVKNIKGDDLQKLVSGGKFLTTQEEIVKALGVPTQITDDKHVASSTISGVASDFKMPQVWKSSIGVDYQVPTSFPFTLTGEFMYTKNISACFVNNINLKEPTAKFGGADNRPMFDKKNMFYTGSYNTVMLENTNKGYGYTFNITANMEPVENLKLMLAYTKTESKEISGLPGSDPYSTWQGTYVIDGPNHPTVQRSQYVTPDKVIASVGYYLPYKWGVLRGTNLNLFYQGFSYSGNSVMYSNDMNGDGITNDLMYIPANDNEIQFKNDENGAQRKAFWAFVEQDSYLKNHKGEYAEAFAARAPWLHRFDFRLTQDLGFKVGKTDHKFQLSLDIQNIGNMINSSWGIPKYCGNTTYTISPLKYEGTDANNVPMFSMNKDKDGNFMKETYSTYKNYAQCWKLQIGLKYIFSL